MSNHYVYILASKKNGTLYIGVTTDLVRRIFEHKNKTIEGFTSKYNVHNLVYYEHYEDYEQAAHREKCMKEWKREWKIKRIEENNPHWRDLYDDITGSVDSGLRRNASNFNFEGNKNHGC